MCEQPELCIPESIFDKKLSQIKAWVFDWDGVFNNAQKDVNRNNTFNERDSMGTNMLRYAHYMHNDSMPFCAIVTGATNQMPPVFALREHFHALVTGALYKKDVVTFLLNEWGIKAEETAFIFDDILDLSVSEMVGLRVQVRYQSSPALNDYVDRNGLADLIIPCLGENQAVRRFSDFIVQHWEMSDEVIQGRTQWNDSYKRYFEERQAIETKVVSRKELLKLENR